MKPILTPHPISVTLIAETPDDAYEIAYRWVCDILHEDPDRVPWNLINWRSTLVSRKQRFVELYLLFPLKTKLTRFMRELAKSAIQYRIFENKNGV